MAVLSCWAHPSTSFWQYCHMIISQSCFIPHYYYRNILSIKHISSPLHPLRHEVCPEHSRLTPASWTFGRVPWCLCVHVCVCMCVCACVYVCMHVCMYVFSMCHVCMYVCMHVFMYICSHVCVYACMFVCMYVCVCVSIMYVCVYVCMYIHT